MFSVVIPVYNKAPYLAKAIKSVKDQTFTDWELILVDDGSTDSSLQVIKDSIVGFDSQIKFFLQPNQGVSVARNNGVAASQYEYVAFLDADDWWEPGFLEEMAFLINNYSNAAWFASDYYYIKHGSKRIADKGIPVGFKSGYLDFIKIYSRMFCVLVNCSFVVIKKDIFFQLGGFKKKLKFGEDIHLWLQLACSFPLAFSAKPLSNSFQDVDASRAIGWKIYSPESSFLFDFDDILRKNPDNKELKFLIDGLRVRGLWKYRLSGKYKIAYQQELAKVDWASQPIEYKKYYTWPLVFWKLYWFLRKLGSEAKTWFYKK